MQSVAFQQYFYRELKQADYVSEQQFSGILQLKMDAISKMESIDTYRHILMGKTVKTIADIAKIASVSKSTVSRALNDSPLISQETRKKIKAIALENQFEVHQGARCLSLSRSQTIALIIPLAPHKEHFITDPFFVELLRGIMVAIGQHHYDLLIGQPQKHDTCEIQRYIDSKRADGLILMGGCMSYLDKFIDPLAQSIPAIVWGTDKSQRFCSVDCDNLNGARLATQHLLQMGRQKIALLGGFQTAPEMPLRYQGYTDMLRESGDQFDPTLVTYGDYSSSSGYTLMRQLLQHTPDIDGVFACSDLMAIGAMEALREHSRRVPEDVSVVGFDDVPLAEHCSPPLTTIRQNISKAGEVMVHNLVQYLQDGIISRTILPVELVVRKSSVPKR
jgi:DNA-binding LacI/PurR family transcriptional regulator